jgi:hypothetical protein
VRRTKQTLPGGDNGIIAPAPHIGNAWRRHKVAFVEALIEIFKDPNAARMREATSGVHLPEGRHRIAD